MKLRVAVPVALVCVLVAGCEPGLWQTTNGVTWHPVGSAGP